MSDSVSVQYEGLITASGDFQAKAGQLESTVTDLNGQINAVLADFHGATATNFRTNLGQLNNAMTELKGVITQFSTVLSEAEATYRGADNTAAGLFH
jgi:WXG100 family type VII secretion target